MLCISVNEYVRLGDNNADWDHYLISIAELLEFAALFQIPMVGSGKSQSSRL